jgi:aryl-alcohol dehydrogenase-like predicted oxidoreductase
MEMIRLGRTGLTVSKNGFGALPVQRVGMEEACRILRKAYDGGINYFDTARFYTDSEEKIGEALGDVREKIIISTKTMATTVEGFWADLKTSLSLLKTDYVDIYQFHNPSFCPKPGDGTGLYEAMLEAKERGMIRHIGFTNHRLAVAEEAVRSGLYDTLQFPFSYLASEKEEALVRLCDELDVGFICMKALAGGLITRSDVAYAYLAQYPVAPIWGIQRMSELEEFLSYNDNPPTLTEERLAYIAEERRELAGDFCRGCGYCMPCPVGIEINTCARMSLLLRRSPSAGHLSEAAQAKMMKIKDCLHCNQCASKCPYGLNTPELLARNLKDYEEILAGKPIEPYNL